MSVGTFTDDRRDCIVGTEAPPLRTPMQFSSVTRTLYFAGRLVKVEGRPWTGGYVEWPQPDRLSSNARHHPYGEERGTSSTESKFATYQREASGLDYAMNRYYSSVYGRFLSSDPYRASGGPSDPGSWNRYAYVQGDPVNTFDPEGLATCSATAFSFVNGAATAQIYCQSNGQTIGRYGVMDVPWGDPRDAAYYAYVVAMAVATLGRDVDSAEAEEEKGPYCFAQLKYRPVDDARARVVGATHSFWWVQTSSGTQFILSGGQEGGYLRAWATKQKDGKFESVDQPSNLTAYKTDSNSTAGLCDKVEKMVSAAEKFPTDKVRYSPVLGPNSNSMAHYLALSGDLYPTTLPPGAIGWDIGVVVPK